MRATLKKEASTTERFPIRLDLANGYLCRGEQILTLRPKTLAVLRFLMNHPGQLVPHEEIQTRVWEGASVTPGTLKNCISELRTALADPAHAPQYIETVPRLGYRFIGTINGQSFTTFSRSSSQANGQHGDIKTESPPSRFGTLRCSASPSFRLVGRAPELSLLHGQLATAMRGERQVIFLTGELGIGKTALVRTFIKQAVATHPELWVIQGQCIEHYGVVEAYSPILNAIGRLGREVGHERLVSVLRQHAPTWLTQLPGLLNRAEQIQLQEGLSLYQDRVQERMLRELAEGLEILTETAPLLLVVEDLHWSDRPTLDLISTMARWQEHARLLFIGTYREADITLNKHPLQTVKQELYVHGQCQEVPLVSLTEGAVAEHLADRFGENPIPPQLARALHQRTEGNPLFLITLTDELIARRALARTGERWTLRDVEDVAQGIPKGIQQLLETKITHLGPEEQRVLHVASVAGMEFSAAAVAVGLNQEVPRVEELCESLARHHQLLQMTGQHARSERRRAGRYRFFHAMYRDVIYAQVPPAWRTLLHKRIATWQETTLGQRATKCATELAVHFEGGHDYRQAVKYRRQAAQTAAQRSAYREALGHLTVALELFQTLPNTPESTQQELDLHNALGAVLVAAKGYAAPEVEHVYTRARELCQQLGEPVQLFRVLHGLSLFHLFRGDLQKAHDLGEQLLSLAQSAQDPALLYEAHHVRRIAFFYSGEFVAAQTHLEQSEALHDPQRSSTPNCVSRANHGESCWCTASLTLWHLGYPDQAFKKVQAALAQAYDPYNRACALFSAAVFHQLCGDDQQSQELAEAVINLSTDQEFSLLLAMGTVLEGWALTKKNLHEKGIALMHEGCAAYRATQATVGQSYFLALLAEAYGKREQAQEGLRVLAEALTTVDRSGERFYEAELYRLKGELLLQSHVQHSQSAVQEEVEQCFRQAVDIAHDQKAQSLELRAVMSLSRLKKRQRQKEEAKRIVAETYGRFTEGFDTADLKEAQALLQELS